MSTTEPTTVGDLRETQTGRTITVHDGDVEVTGPFTGLRIDQDWIEDYTADDPEPRRVPGRKTVTVTIGRWVSGDLPPSTPVTLRGDPS
jgi:hypothetical protein